MPAMIPGSSDQQDVFLRDLIEPFIAYEITKGLSRGTIARVRTNMKLFTDWCMQNKYEAVSQLNDLVLRDYVKHLYDRPNMHPGKEKLSKSTISKHIDFLKHFSQFLVESRYVVDDYSKKLVRPTPSYRVIQAFTDEQIRLIFDELTRFRSLKRKRMQVAIFLLMLLDTGLRISEALHLTPQTVNFDTRLMTVIGKRDKQREVPFSERVSMLLQKVIAANETKRDEYIWKSPITGNPFTTASVRKTLQTIKKRLGTQAGIDNIRLSPHTFRHTFAKNWIMNGGDPFSLQKILGHESVEETMKYVHLWGYDLAKKHDTYKPAHDLGVEDWMVFLEPKPRKYKRKEKVVSEIKGMDGSGVPMV